MGPFIHPQQDESASRRSASRPLKALGLCWQFFGSQAVLYDMAGALLMSRCRTRKVLICLELAARPRRAWA